MPVAPLRQGELLKPSAGARLVEHAPPRNRHVTAAWLVRARMARVVGLAHDEVAAELLGLARLARAAIAKRLGAAPADDEPAAGHAAAGVQVAHLWLRAQGAPVHRALDRLDTAEQLEPTLAGHVDAVAVVGAPAARLGTAYEPIRLVVDVALPLAGPARGLAHAALVALPLKRLGRHRALQHALLEGVRDAGARQMEVSEARAVAREERARLPRLLPALGADGLVWLQSGRAAAAAIGAGRVRWLDSLTHLRQMKVEPERVTERGSAIAERAALLNPIAAAAAHLLFALLLASAAGSSAPLAQSGYAA